MAEVGVHAHEVVVAMRYGIAHAGEDGGAQAELSSAVIDVNARVSGGELVGKLSSAVRRVVISDENVCLGDESVNLLHKRCEVVALLVSGDSNQHAR